MPAGVFITGGGGFVGSAILRQLVTRQHSAHALSHHHVIDMFGQSVHSFRGDLFDRAMIDQAMRGCDAVMHVVGIIMQKPSRGITFERIHFEGTKGIVDAAVRNGVKRFIHMSALGSRPDAQSDYHKTKFRAEEYLRASGLEWTIFRPSLIHGPQGEFMAAWRRNGREEKRRPFCSCRISAPDCWDSAVRECCSRSSSVMSPAHLLMRWKNREPLARFIPLAGRIG